MNEKKIAFIYCYNDEKLLNESILYIQSLNIPVGYELEIIPVEGATSMTAGYNFAMKQSDAKYKVYLHQDVFIVNRNFIRDVLAIFKQNEKVGLLGMVGAKVLPTNGIWWEAHEKFGKVYDSHTGSMELLSFNESANKIVEAIDGLIMVTQYDIPWREDIFKGWHFYDISQCMEFINKGFNIVVPNQEQGAWVVHDCGIVNTKNGFERDRNIFIKNYKFGDSTFSQYYSSKNIDYYNGINLNIVDLVDPSAKVILEIGCGEGNLGGYLKKKYGCLVKGVELYTPAAIKAKNKLDEVYNEDIENLGDIFQENTFDHIIFGDVLEHLQDPWSTLIKVKPLLRDGGSIITSIPNTSHISLILELLNGSWSYQNAGLLDKTHLRFFTLKEIILLFQTTGFEIENIKSIEVSNNELDNKIHRLDSLLYDLGLHRKSFIQESRAYQYVVKAQKK